MLYKVKEVADLVGVSVRTLHYYDKIGLLKPESVNSSGYRFYNKDDLERLQQILFFKELDFSLQEINDILNSPSFDREHALSAHRDMLLEKKMRLEKIIISVEKTIRSIKGEIEMDNKDMFNGFDITDIEKHKEKYADEVKQKYGKTNAYEESQRKTSKYTKNDWDIIIKSQNEIYIKLADLMDKGIENEEVQKVVGEWRQHINNNFYTCSAEIFRGLAQMYIYDERFTNNIDKIKPGLATFLSESMEVYCDNLIK